MFYTILNISCKHVTHSNLCLLTNLYITYFYIHVYHTALHKANKNRHANVLTITLWCQNNYYANNN